MKTNGSSMIFFALIVALLAFIGLIFHRAVQKANLENGSVVAAVINVRVVHAAEAAIREEVSFVGSIEAEETVPVYPKLGDLTIEKIVVNVGDYVKKGQLLAQLDSSLMVTNLRQVKQILGTAEAGLRQADSTYQMCKKDFERYRDLVGDGVVSRQEFDRVENQYRIAEEARSAARFQLEESRAALSNVQINIGYHNLVATASGVISARNADPGDKSDSGAPMFVISRVEHLKLAGAVPESAFMDLRVGAQAIVTAEALPGRSFEASVSRIYPTLDADTRSGRVELAINSNGILKPGLYARGTIKMGEHTGLLLPRETMRQLRGSPHWQIFVVSGDHGVEARTVKLGVDLGSTVEILEGVSREDRVIATQSERFQEQNIQIEVLKEVVKE